MFGHHFVVVVSREMCFVVLETIYISNECEEVRKLDSCQSENNYCDHELKYFFGIIESENISMERFLCLGNSSLYERKLTGKN